MEFPMTTAVTAAAIAFLQVALMMRVGLTRARSGVGIGDGGSETMALLIRSHGNLTENAPLFLILLALSELAGAAPWVITSLAAGFVVARLAHAVALSTTSGPHPLRVVGAMGTVLTILVAAGQLLWLSF